MFLSCKRGLVGLHSANPVRMGSTQSGEEFSNSRAITTHINVECTSSFPTLVISVTRSEAFKIKVPHVFYSYQINFRFKSTRKALGATMINDLF